MMLLMTVFTRSAIRWLLRTRMSARVSFVRGFWESSCAISSEVSPISAMRRWYMVSPPVWGLVVIISQVGSGLRGGEMDGAFLVLVA